MDKSSCRSKTKQKKNSLNGYIYIDIDMDIEKCCRGVMDTFSSKLWLR